MEYWKNQSLENLRIKVQGEWIDEFWHRCSIYTQAGEFLDYSSYYETSSFGRIKSLGREIAFVNRWGHKDIRETVDKILLPYPSKNGYLRQALSIGPDTSRAFSIHRIVASTFWGNPCGLPEVNHEDGIKFNNYVNNLKWCTREYNQRHATQYGLNIPKKSWEDIDSKAVEMTKFGCNKKYLFGSMGEANREIGISRASVRDSCENNKALLKGKFKGCKFKYI